MPCLFDEIFNDPDMNEKVFGDFFAIKKSSKLCNNVNQISEKVFLCMKEKLLKIALQEGICEETFENIGIELIGKKSKDELMNYLKRIDKYQGTNIPPFEKFYEDWNGWDAVQYDECKDHLRRFINGESKTMSFTNRKYHERRYINRVCKAFGFSYSCDNGIVCISRDDGFTFMPPRMLSKRDLNNFLKS